MPLTRPIPDEAMAVVEVIRRDVPRPKELPEAYPSHDGKLRWTRRKPPDSFGKGCCPMGLHPKSIDWIPSWSHEFAGGLCSLPEVEAFYDWWDGERDPLAATNALWPLPQPKTASVESTETDDE